MQWTFFSTKFRLLKLQWWQGIICLAHCQNCQWQQWRRLRHHLKHFLWNHNTEPVAVAPTTITTFFICQTNHWHSKGKNKGLMGNNKIMFFMNSEFPPWAAISKLKQNTNWSHHLESCRSNQKKNRKTENSTSLSLRVVNPHWKYFITKVSLDGGHTGQCDSIRMSLSSLLKGEVGGGYQNATTLTYSLWPMNGLTDTQASALRSAWWRSMWMN